jgi:hypothetical protein
MAQLEAARGVCQKALNITLRPSSGLSHPQKIDRSVTNYLYMLSIWLSYPDNQVSIRRSYIDLLPTLAPSLLHPGLTHPG